MRPEVVFLNALLLQHRGVFSYVFHHLQARTPHYGGAVDGVLIIG